ncbi:FAD-dependent oxidoreductase [Flavipsychrobacter stenotrophus]|uniref:FAD-dependent oxidoreductase n=1 Tax=Flavipsychrobacter stenotrophus TaxID=2077091 RepID=A0A2S7SSP1_9BACT|nr:FAD-dependent oxidoreductase [Flavipsychrobacter stenotrophus]PQJ09930.1 FAD-dependent oxidoreductase [Flavipsychrobacter stenotrophus]
MFSYWEQESFTRYDHIVIGAGIVGLSMAIELKDKFPATRVLVLERGLLPTGASTRNAGFACMGSATELLDDLQHTTETEAVELFEWRKKGLELLRKRLGDSNIGYRENGSYELISTDELEALDKLEYLNQLLLPITGKPAFRLANDKVGEFGFSKDYTKALIENNCEGELHSGMMMRALTDMAISKGIEIKTGADVIKFDDLDTRVEVLLRDPFRNETSVLHCDKLFICTNAFTKQLLPDVDVVPGRGQVVITHPVPGLKFKGIYHFDKGYYYFREIDGRVLLGGGRNLDFKTENTTDFALNEMIQADLVQKLYDIILPSTPFTIDRRWTGIMAFGANKFPIVKAFSPRVFGAFRMGGMGVALGSEAARRLVEIVAEGD